MFQIHNYSVNSVGKTANDIVVTFHRLYFVWSKTKKSLKTYVDAPAYMIHQDLCKAAKVHDS